ESAGTDFFFRFDPHVALIPVMPGLAPQFSRAYPETAWVNDQENLGSMFYYAGNPRAAAVCYAALYRAYPEKPSYAGLAAKGFFEAGDTVAAFDYLKAGGFFSSGRR